MCSLQVPDSLQAPVAPRNLAGASESPLLAASYQTPPLRMPAAQRASSRRAELTAAFLPTPHTHLLLPSQGTAGKCLEQKMMPFPGTDPTPCPGKPLGKGTYHAEGRSLAQGDWAAGLDQSPDLSQRFSSTAEAEEGRVCSAFQSRRLWIPHSPPCRLS